MSGRAPCEEDGCERLSHPKAGYGRCLLHYQRRKRAGTLLELTPRKLRTKTAEEKFLAFTEVSKSCWWWTGPTNQSGYGYLTQDYHSTYAHRWIWEHLVGPIPDGLTIDHLCTNKVCVNPEHLEVVPLEVNSSRRHGNRIFCPLGHSLDDAYFRPDGGGRQCATCVKRRTAARWANRQQVACEYCGRVLSDENMRAHQTRYCKSSPKGVTP